MYSAGAISLHWFPTTSKAAGVQIDYHPADDTAEIGDRNFFSRNFADYMYRHTLLHMWI